MAIYYVAPSNASPAGSDSNSGTVESPWFTLNHAWNYVLTGDTIYMKGGVYNYVSQQLLDGKSGVAAQNGNDPPIRINIWAVDGEIPILTRGGGIDADWVSYHGRGIIMLIGDYIHIKGLEITGFTQPEGNIAVWSAMRSVSPNYCIFEDLNIHHCGDGLCIINNNANPPYDSYTGTWIINCDFHHNFDPYSTIPGGNASGLSLTRSGAGSQNYIRGCRFWWNTDNGINNWLMDGWVQIDHCWSFYNGWAPDTFDIVYNGIQLDGDGVAFKLGKIVNNYPTTPLRYVYDCVAYKNTQHGFDINIISGKGYTAALYNNTAYLNGIIDTGGTHYGTGFNFGTDNLAHIFNNNIALSNVLADANTGTQSNVNACTFLVGWNQPNSALPVDTGDFVFITQTGATGMDAPRKTYKDAFGTTLPDINFLHLSPSSNLVNAGWYCGIPFHGSNPDLGAFESGKRRVISI